DEVAGPGRRPAYNVAIRGAVREKNKYAVTAVRAQAPVHTVLVDGVALDQIAAGRSIRPRLQHDAVAIVPVDRVALDQIVAAGVQLDARAERIGSEAVVTGNNIVQDGVTVGGIS